MNINFLSNINSLKALSKQNLYYILFVAAIVACTAGSSLIWANQNRQQVAVEEPIVVRTAVVGTAGAMQGYTYSGAVRGRYESQLAFQVNGKIIKRNVQLGSVVSAGDVLMQIDAKDIQQTLNNSSAQVYSAESQRVLAESNLSRYRQLLEQGAISPAQYDQYVNAYNVAVAGVQQASAQYAQGANQLDYSLLQADKPGIVSAISAEIGQVVSAGQVVVTMVQDGEREVEINVPENRIEELRKAGQVSVSFWALPNVVVNGQVREIAPMADQTTRTFKVRISLLNAPAEAKLGMTAAVNIAGSSAGQLISIPIAAIYQDGDIPKVWVVQDNVLALHEVQAGSFGNGTIQVLGGLKPGDRIVVAGVHKLKEGQKVQFGGDSL